MQQPRDETNAHPVAAAVRKWLATAQVLADPYQLGQRGVWTRAEDVLPGVVVTPGEPLVAVWEDLVWIGVPSWDPGEVGVLWLEPVEPPAIPPNPYIAYPPISAMAGVRRACAQGTGAADFAEFERALQALLADFAESLRLLIAAVRANRRVAQAVLEELSLLPPQIRRHIVRTAAGRDLFRMARRARLPPRALHR